MPHIPVEEFSKNMATHIISLGGRCATAYNLRRYYKFTTSYPFDWWICGAKSALAVLRNPDINYIYHPDQLEMTGDRKGIRHKDLGITFFHDFPWEKDPAKPKGMAQNFAELVDGPRTKIGGRLKRVLDLNQAGNRIFFIREGGPSAELDQGIREALSNLYPDAECSFGFVQKIPSVPGFDWKLSPALWDGALSRFDVTLDLEVEKTAFAAMAEKKGAPKEAEAA